MQKWIGLAGRGKRDVARTLVATNKGNRWFFLYEIEKNDRANITDDELEALKEIADQLLARTGRQLDEAIQDIYNVTLYGFHTAYWHIYY